MINDGMLKRSYKNYSIILVMILIVIYTISKMPNVFRWVTSTAWKYYVLPGIWFFLIGLISRVLPRIHPDIRIIRRLNIYFDAILCAILFIIIKYIVGILIYKVCKTPYDQTGKGILLNLLTIIVPFIAFELIRAYVIGTYCKNRNILLFLFTVVIISTMYDTNWSNLLAVKNLEEVTVILAKEIAPDMCINIMLSCLAYYGGAAAAIVYGGLLLIFHWFFPYLPQMNWLGEAVIGILIPVMELVYIINKYSKKYVRKRESRKEWKDTLSWFLTLSFSVVVIWFVVGVFPIYPQVIMTGSMEPLINPGDVVIVKKFSSEAEIRALQPGDIIVFQRDEIIITHRIIEVSNDKEGNLCFETKGDNNSSEDTRLVRSKELKGRYFSVIPKLGYPSYLLKSGNLDKIHDVVN